MDDNNVVKIRELDFELCLDNTEFSTLIPVVRPNSQLFFSYVCNIHLRIKPHSGIEITVQELMKKMFIIGHFRYVIKRVRNDCSKCSIILKKTVELELSKHHYSRTLIAPVFYSIQVDIVYGFRAKVYRGVKKISKIYAFVITCLHTSATNILVLESIDTQSVVLAIERHACRYGMPVEVYIDNGSQLKALDKAEFSIRDLDAQVYDARGIRVVVSNAKSHQERGKVERKVRILREMLEKHDLDEKYPLTCIAWETVFAKMANAMDDIPIARGNSTNLHDSDFELLTPNRLKLGRNNYRSPYINTKICDQSIPSELLEQNRKIMSAFYKVLVDNLHHFQTKPSKWGSTSSRLPLVDDIVLFKFNESNADIEWKLGRVVKTSDRNATIMYSLKKDPKAIPTMKFLSRSLRDIVILFSETDIYQNSKSYFESVIKNN